MHPFPSPHSDFGSDPLYEMVSEFSPGQMEMPTPVRQAVCTVNQESSHISVHLVDQATRLLR